MCERHLASSSPPADPSDHLLSNTDLRRTKASRTEFSRLERLPITVVLDRVRRNYNLGALFRLCDAMRVELLVIGGTEVNVRKRKQLRRSPCPIHLISNHRPGGPDDRTLYELRNPDKPRASHTPGKVR